MVEEGTEVETGKVLAVYLRISSGDKKVAPTINLNKYISTFYNINIRAPRGMLVHPCTVISVT